MGLTGTAGAVAVYFSAPLLVRVALGPEFAPATAVLRVLSLLLPITALNMALAYQWMLPLNLEGPLARIVLIAGCINFLIIAIFATTLRESAGAWAAVVAEGYNLAAMVSLLTRLRASARPEMEGVLAETTVGD
jgi:PST family polysaccharide transporter